MQGNRRRGTAAAAAVAALTILALPAHAQPQVTREQCMSGGGVPVTVEFKGTCVGGTFNGQPIDNPTEAGPGALS